MSITATSAYDLSLWKTRYVAGTLKQERKVWHLRYCPLPPRPHKDARTDLYTPSRLP